MSRAWMIPAHSWLAQHIVHAAVAGVMIVAPVAAVKSAPAPKPETTTLVGNDATYNGKWVPGLAGSDDVVFVKSPSGWCYATDPTRIYGLLVVTGPTDPRCL